jgi:hypothetical protein
MKEKAKKKDGKWAWKNYIVEKGKLTLYKDTHR